MLNPKFQNGNYYHIINRGNDKRKIFMDDDGYLRFLLSLRLFNSFEPIGSIKNLQKRNSLFSRRSTSGKPDVERRENRELVDIVAYCLIPNHFHLLLKQKEEGGISEFMRRMGGYTKYINLKYNCSGSLFQGRYKAFEIKSDGKLWETSFYINGNAEIHKIAKADKWKWSSCLDYLNLRKGDLCQKNAVLDDFENIAEYKKELFNYIREKKLWKEEIKKYED
jgi:putative transposase